jgi:maltooligosyltrehalose trehalohydrolase
VTWTFAAGTLRLLANFGDNPMSGDIEDDSGVLWSSQGINANAKNLQLPPWSGVIVKGRSA